MIKTHHGKAIKRQIFDEGTKRFFNRIEGFEMIEMLGINIGNNGNIRWQLEKGPIGLIGLNHHPFAVTKPRIRAIGIDNAAIDHGRVEMSGHKQGCNKRCRRCLAMGSGNRHAGFKPHEFRQHFSAAHHWKSPLARCH